MLSLRPYQESTISQIRQEFLRGRNRVAVVSPTGSGKRFLAVWMSRETANRNRRALFVANRKTLVKQMLDELCRFGVPHGVQMGDHPGFDLSAPVQVGCVATLRRRYANEPLPPFDLIVVDEAHRELDFCRWLYAALPRAFAVGLSATPIDSDGCSIVAPGLYHSMVVGATNSQLMSCVPPLLLPTRVFCPSQPDMRGVRIHRGDWDQKQAARRVQSVTVFADIIKEWERWRHLRTVLFCNGVEFARGLASDFVRRAGVRAASIDCKTSLSEREDLFAAIAAHDLDVLCSVGVLKEGFDCPSISCGIDLQPTLQYRDYIQKTGRVRRPSLHREDCVWLDFSGAYWVHGHPDEDFDWASLEPGRSIEEVERPPPRGIICPQCKAVRKGGRVCPACGHEIADVARAERVRYVRMGDGRLVESQSYCRPGKPKRAAVSYEESQWKKALYRAANSNRTWRQACWLYKQQTGRMPPPGLPLMPPMRSSQWSEKVTRDALRVVSGG